jgi:hypothetical protein
VSIHWHILLKQINNCVKKKQRNNNKNELKTIKKTKKEKSKKAKKKYNVKKVGF